MLMMANVSKLRIKQLIFTETENGHSYSYVPLMPLSGDH